MSRLQTVHQAVRRGQKARLALAGPAGAGKTWTALTIAGALVPDGTVLVIDTEKGSASLYADTFTFDTVEWSPPYDPRELADTIRDAAAKYDVIVVDSLSHFWQGEGGTLDIVDNASQRAQGNKFAGWKTGTPAQNDMVEAILAAPAHVLVTMRSKMEYVLEQDDRGRKVPRKVGMAPVQRDAIEYEFTVTADLDTEHRVTITKTRCDLLADKVFQPGKAGDLAAMLGGWLESAEPAPEPEQSPPIDDEPVTAEAVRRFAIQVNNAGLSDDHRHALVFAASEGRVRSSKELMQSEWPALRQWFRRMTEGDDYEFAEADDGVVFIRPRSPEGEAA